MAANAFSLTDRSALVTGGNGGLGRAIALGVRAAGASVAVTAGTSTRTPPPPPTSSGEPRAALDGVASAPYDRVRPPGMDRTDEQIRARRVGNAYGALGCPARAGQAPAATGA